MEDIFSGPSRSEEMGSLLFKSLDNPDCTLRICSLQKLKVRSSTHFFFLLTLNVMYLEIVYICKIVFLVLGITGHKGGSALYSCDK